MFGEKGRHIDRMPLQLFEKDEQPVIGHPLRVEDTIEVIAFMLDDAGMEALDGALDDLPLGVRPAIADAQVPGHDPPQSGDRQATLPTERPLRSDELNDRVDQYRQILGDIAGHLGDPLVRNPEDDNPVWLVDLRRGDAGAPGILHRLDHVLDEPAYPWGRRIIDRARGAAQYWVPHAGDFQQSHGRNMWCRQSLVKRLQSPSQRPAEVLDFVRLGRLRPPATGTPIDRRSAPVQVLVRDNNVDQALRALKKKMQREGVFREMKLRRNYEKPSERRAREKAEAVRRYRKLLRKRLEREGY